MKIILSEILKGKTYPEAGTEFFNVLQRAIETNQKLRIDMEGVDSIPTMFMTNSFGRIMNEYGVKKLKETMMFSRISKSQIDRISKYLTDYAEVYNVTE